MKEESKLVYNANCRTKSIKGDFKAPLEGFSIYNFSIDYESKGDFNNLIETISECCVHLGLVDTIEDIPIFKYKLPV